MASEFEIWGGVRVLVLVSNRQVVDGGQGATRNFQSM